MMKLVQNDECSIVYDEKGEETFRCPRELDDKDLVRYINEHRIFLGFEKDDVSELYEVDGMEVVDYWRMYFRSGEWCGRWMNLNRQEPLKKIEPVGVNNIIKWLTETFPNGCDWKMTDYFEKNFPTWGENEHVYLLKPIGSKYYKVTIHTEFGNGDYPVRIYVYREKENENG